MTTHDITDWLPVVAVCARRALRRLPRRCHAAHLIELEDLVQAGLVGVWRRARSHDGTPPTWKIGVWARNAITDELRIRVRARHTPSRWQAGVNLTGAQSDGLRDRQPDVLAVLEAHDALAGLTPARREVVELRMAGCGMGEIAHRLGLSYAAVLARFHAAREHIRRTGVGGRQADAVGV